MYPLLMPYKDPEKARAAQNAYNAANREKVNTRGREASRRWRANDPDRALAKSREQYANNTEARLESSRKWRDKNPEKVKEQSEKQRKKLEANPELLEKSRAYKREYMRKYNKDNPRALKNIHFKTLYGITLDEYEALEKKQGYVCAICGGPETHLYKGALRRLAVDHCHILEHVRGLLCAR